jgi:hypothetical protein
MQENVFLKKSIWILLLLFLFSVAIRLPNLNRPLSKHHEFCTALTLLILHQWQKEGIAALDAQPSTSYKLPADRFINNFSLDTMQRDGRFYYLSHPPLAYYIPFAAFQLLDIPATPPALQILNLFFAFITLLFVYLITAMLVRCDVRKHLCREGVGAAALYLFLPATLWFHGNVYMADLFVHNAWAPVLFVALKIFIDRKENLAGWISLFCLLLALMIYTGWLGVFFAFSVFITALVYARRHGIVFLRLAALTAFIAIGIILLVLWQYSSIAGWSTLQWSFLHRYAERGSLHWKNFNEWWFVVRTIGFNYAAGYLPLLPVALFFFYQAKNRLKENPAFVVFVLLSLLPVVLDHVVFLRYAVQDLAVLKASFFLSIVSAILLFRLFGKANPRWLIAAVAVICLAGIGQYYFINRPGEFSIRGHRYDTAINTGLLIRNQAKNDEVVFVTNLEVSPQLVYYAQRNIKRVRDATSAAGFLQTHPASKGIIFSSVNDSLFFRRIRE